MDGRWSTKVLQGFGSRLVFGEEASLAVVEASLAWVLSGTLQTSQLGRL
jgi:hypothetical protein